MAHGSPTSLQRLTDQAESRAAQTGPIAVHDEVNPCPLCGDPLYAWIALPAAGGEASVGMPLSALPDEERILDRCESCGVAIEHGRKIDLLAEWEAVCRAGDGGGREIAVPNRASLQAAIGVEGWAAIGLSPGSLLFTPDSLRRLAALNGQPIEQMRWPRWGRTQGWMLQTLLNGLTFHPNFAREVQAGRLRRGSGRGAFRFYADAVVTILGAPLIALVSFPLELLGAIFKRGGEITARTSKAT